MMNRTWLGNRAVIWLSVVVIPPLGLFLVWRRKGSRLAARLLASLAAIVFGIAHLFLFWGLTVEMDGGMTRPIFTFRNPDRHNEAIERRRQEEQSMDASRMQMQPTTAMPAASVLPGEEPAPETAPLTARVVPRDYWTEFRGPGRVGIYTESGIMTAWPSDGLPLLWKRPVGGGYASVVVAEGRIFTIEQRREKEVVASYDLDTGRERWIHGWDAEFREILGGDGPRATPVWHEGSLYALGATGELRCLDARSGMRIWSRNILSDNGAENLQWGMAATPLIVDEKVVVLPGGPEGKSVVAYNRLTGDPVWKALDERQAYVSPLLADLAGRRQILVVSASRVMGLAPEDGSLLWAFPWVTMNGINVAQPVVTADDRFFISSGYGRGAALIEISAHGDTYEAHAVWESSRMKNKFSSSVLYNGYIYGFDEAILACVDAANGDLKWKGGRYGYGQLLLASGHLVITAENGDVVLVKAVPESHQEVARHSALNGKTWNVPAIAHGMLIVRNSTEMACFRIGR